MRFIMDVRYVAGTLLKQRDVAGVATGFLRILWTTRRAEHVYVRYATPRWRKKMEKTIELKDKWLLSIDEAATYFGIGSKKVRAMSVEGIEQGWALMNGSKT